MDGTLGSGDVRLAAEEAEQRDAERSFWRSGVLGALIGMVLGAVVWAGLVAVALAGSGWSLGPPLWMAAGVGVFAGAFLGGWAGVMVGVTRLDHVEHEQLLSRSG